MGGIVEAAPAGRPGRRTLPDRDQMPSIVAPRGYEAPHDIHRATALDSWGGTTDVFFDGVRCGSKDWGPGDIHKVTTGAT